MSVLYRLGSRRLKVATLAAGVALCFAGTPILAQTQLAQPPANLNRSAAAAEASVALPSFGPMVKRVLPAVVNISVDMKAAPEEMSMEGPGEGPGEGPNQGPDAGPGQGMQPGSPNSPFDQFLRRFFDQQQQQGQGFGGPRGGHAVALGSGFIIDPSGYIVTNNHVVENAGKVTVIFQDGTKHPAKVIGADPKTDLALVKIDNAGQPLPYVEWGDSNKEEVGDWVLAVGNPFGLGGTVSSGIISARGRDIHEGPYDDFLQLDAAINRGNSGGPTFNLDGKVIGINTAIYSPNGGSVGIGFAIPSSLAEPVIDQLKEHGKVERGWLGVQIQEVTPEIAKDLSLPKAEGALVADVTPDSPAAKVGVKQGDVIVGYDGHDIAKLRDLPLAVAETTVGKAASMTIWRDGHDQTLQPTIAQMPNNLEVASKEGGRAGGSGGESAAHAMGVTLQALTPELRQQLHVAKSVHGVVVDSVADFSPLASLGIQRGDVIEQINRHDVATPEEATKALDALQQQTGEKRLLLLLNRHGINEYVATTVTNDNNG